VSFVFGWGLPSSIIESHQNKNGCGPGPGELPKISGSPFHISATAELATSNLVDSLGLPRPIIKSNPEEKVGAGLG